MSGIEASLGVAAGGAGLLSLALQLGETAVKLKRIFFSLKNAPRTVSRLVFDLETMALTLHTLEQYRQQDIHGGTLLARCITECQERTSEIQHLVGKMDQCMTKHEKFGGRVYTAFKEREVKELLSELDRAKSSLELACAMFFATRQMQRDEAYISILNQHGTLLSSLQAEISSGNANTSQQSPLLLQPETTSYPRLRTTPEMQMITNIERNTTGIFRNNEHASPPDHSPLAKKAGRKNDKDLKLIDLKLRSWFGHRIWEFTVRKAYCRWSMHLSTYNVVPGDSMIFHYAEVGDIVGIQRLIERGEGSLLDVGYARYGETLIEAAARFAQFEVIRYLLRETAWPDQTRTLSNALSWFNNNISNTGEKAVEIYRMITNAPGFDADLEDTSLAYGWLGECPNMRCLDLILENQVWNVAYLSVETRFEIALEFRSYNIRCSDILGFIGLRPSDQKLISLRSSNGMSLLHYIATRMRNYFSSSEDQAWFDLGVNIVKGGADLFSISQKDLKNHIGPFSRSYYFSLSGKCQRTTPFMELINMTDWGIDMSVNFENFLNEDIRIWAKMMQRAGIDLCDYGTKENQIWESLGIKDHAVFERRESSNIDPTAKIEQLVFGPTPADWSLLYRGYGLIHVFKRQFTPGTYPRELDLPATIIWRPTEEEEGEGPWRTQPRIEIASSQRVLRYHRAQEEKHPFTQLIENTQDDTSTIMLMQYWISRPKSSKSRSHSQPPSVQRRQTIIGKWSLSRNWLGHVHFCPFDSHWRPRCARIEKEQGSTIEGIDLPDLRSCVKGISTERLFSLQESEEWKSRSYLADIAVCQDKHEFHPYYYMSTKQLRHTRDRSCPWGCGKVDLNRLQVPEPLREFHPTRKYEEK